MKSLEDYFDEEKDSQYSDILSKYSQTEILGIQKRQFGEIIQNQIDDDNQNDELVDLNSIIEKNLSGTIPAEWSLGLLSQPDFSKDSQQSSRVLTIKKICECIRKNVPIMYFANCLRYFDGHIWKQLTYERFGNLCSKYVPEDLLASMKTLVTVRDSLQYLEFEFVDCENIPIAHTYVAVENGVFDVISEKLYDFSPEFQIINQIKVSYYAVEKRPIEFERFLADMTPDTDMVWYMIADCLLFSPPHRIIWWIGPALASGKSTLASFLTRFLGKENCACVTTSDIGEKFGTSSLTACRYNIAIESSGKIDTKSRVKLKELSGDENISVEQKYHDTRSVVNYSRLIFGSNDSIILDSPDDAFWDRIRIIPAIWSVPRDKRDPDLLEKIWDEREGILRKALEYAQKLINRNYIVPEGSESTKLKEAWKEQCTDEIEFFIKKFVEIDENDPDLFTPTEELFECFSRNCRQAMKKQTFSRKLTAYFAKTGLTLRHSKGEYEGRQVRGFGNIRIRSYEAFDIEEEENE